MPRFLGGFPSSTVVCVFPFPEQRIGHGFCERHYQTLRFIFLFPFLIPFPFSYLPPNFFLSSPSPLPLTPQYPFTVLDLLKDNWV